MRDKQRTQYTDSKTKNTASLTGVLATLVAGFALFMPLPVFAANSVDAPVSARVLQGFKVSGKETRFGKLEFVGGLVLSSREPLFGAMSSIRFRPDGRNFVAVLDTGHWLTGQIQRDTNGKLVSVTGVKITPMLDAAGREPHRKMEMDAEGLVLRDGQVIVSYEQRHRIDVYPDPGFATSRPVKRIPHLIPSGELRANGGMEALGLSPANSPLQGALVVVAEKSIDEDGNLLGAILEGPLKGAFTVSRHPSFDVTDSAFLPDGDLLLLERRFNLAEGVGVRIRRIPAATIKPGAVLDGPVIFEAGMESQIDNMEGMDVIAGPDGATHIILVSDDNHSFLQRNMMLEFRLNE